MFVKFWDTYAPRYEGEGNASAGGGDAAGRTDDAGGAGGAGGAGDGGGGAGGQPGVPGAGGTPGGAGGGDGLLGAKLAQLLPADQLSQSALAEFADKSAADLAAAYVAARNVATAPKDSVSLAAASTDEGRLDVLRKLGAPEAGVGYKYTPAEGIKPEVFQEGFTAKMADAAAAAGVLPGQFKALMDVLGTHVTTSVGEAQSKAEAELKQLDDENEATLRKKYDSDEKWSQFEADVALGFDRLGGEPLQKVIEEAGLGTNPVVLEAFAQVGASMADGSVPSEGGGSAAAVRAQAMEEYNTVLARAADPKTPSHERVDLEAKLERLGKQLFGTAAVA